ncbi:MAG: hypothetical protein V2A77_06765 [Pseudomonadota bacterium]
MVKTGVTIASLLLICVSAVCPSWAREPGGAGASIGFVEHYPEGRIDWASGLVQAFGVSSGGAGVSSAAQAQALEKARRALASLLCKIMVSSGRSVGAFLSGNAAARAEMAEIIQGSQLIDRKYYSDGSVEVRTALSIRGGLMQLLLPREVKSIPSLTQVSGQIRPEAHYSGLVVDARGLGARPALCPRLLAEDGSLVFGPALVRREPAVQHGVAIYVTAMPGGTEGRVGARPLVVKGLRASGQGACDIVLDRAEVSRVRSVPESVDFLQRRGLLIIID